MPQWIHNRAEHILAKNPSMPKSKAFAIATQQSHAVGKSPKSYGTAQGRHVAKAKYPTPKDDKKTANPGHLESSKMASFLDEFSKISEINQMRLHPKSPKIPISKPPNDAFKIKRAFGTSEFSGVMSFGSFPQASMIPPWRQPNLQKQSGPPGDSKLESTDDGVVLDGRAHLKKNAALSYRQQELRSGTRVPSDAEEFQFVHGVPFTKELYAKHYPEHVPKGWLKKNANVSSPSNQLAKSHAAGRQPRLNAPGPSIAQQSKPRGFGSPMPGLTKQSLSIR